MNSKLFYLQRLLGYCLGFVLFYEPFMLFGKLTESFFVETGFTSIHVPCARIPLANILTGEWLASGPTSLFFCLLLAATSLWFGPLFCGRLCPAGGFSEFLSRLLPDKYKIDWSKYVPNPAFALRLFCRLSVFRAAWLGRALRLLQLLCFRAFCRVSAYGSSFGSFRIADADLFRLLHYLRLIH